MAYWLSWFVLRWWQFWRLPETDATRRVRTAKHSAKVESVRRLWCLGGLILLCVPSPPVVVGGVFVLVFMSFAVLDETA
ncbi:MAG: hypothetical protein ACX931_16625 [Saccharospirillum sp.]|jgi:hypothetical protein